MADYDWMYRRTYNEIQRGLRQRKLGALECRNCLGSGLVDHQSSGRHGDARERVRCEVCCGTGYRGGCYA